MREVMESESKNDNSPIDNTLCVNNNDLVANDISVEMKEKCSLSANMQPIKNKSSSKVNWKRRILDKTFSHERLRPFSLDESSELSSEKDNSNSLEKNEFSGIEPTNFNIQRDGKSSTMTTLVDENDPLINKKETKRQKLKRILARPLRRSQSALCESELASPPDNNGKLGYAFSEAEQVNSMFYQRLFGTPETNRRQQRKIHKTFSVDSVLSKSEECLDSLGQNQRRFNKTKNMKRKFQLLRRQNKESISEHDDYFYISSSTSFERAQKWGESFDDLLNDKTGLDVFLRFLKSEFSDENLEFWMACEEYRNCDETNLTVMAQKIYNEFVVSKAPKEINLDSDTRLQTVTNLENLSRDTFKVSQHKIQALMAKDSYPRFLESDIYKFVLENVSKA